MRTRTGHANSIDACVPRRHNNQLSDLLIADSKRSSLPSNSPSNPGRISALMTSETRELNRSTASVARLITSNTSSQVPSISVNILDVRFGSPESRTTFTASATASATEPSLSAPVPEGATEKATIIKTACHVYPAKPTQVTPFNFRQHQCYKTARPGHYPQIFQQLRCQRIIIHRF